MCTSLCAHMLKFLIDIFSMFTIQYLCVSGNIVDYCLSMLYCYLYICSTMDVYLFAHFGVISMDNMCLFVLYSMFLCNELSSET